MLSPLVLVVLAQVTVTVTSGKQTHKDSVRAERMLAREDSLAARRDSIRAARDSMRAHRDVTVSPALLASAFKDPGARALLERARAARMTQDSALESYDATTYERMSVSAKLGALGRSRLLFRTERATHVQWDRKNGAVVDVTGERSALPLVQGAGKADVDMGVGRLPIPYHPGRETLWFGSGLAQANIDPTSLIHPIAVGAEAYYTYSSGDSLALQLPGGKRLLIRELRVQPRAPKWNVVVGSLWFDTSSGQLVRGIFRMSEPMDVFQVAKDNDGEDPGKDIPALMRPLITPITASVDVITVDYGLFDGRFWLPRLQVAEGSARAGVARFPFELRQRFDYNDVNAAVSVPPMQLAVADTGRSVEARRARRAERDSACKDPSQQRVVRRSRYDNTVDVLVRIPCDTALLAHSSTLPKSIFDTPDSLFNDRDMDALVASALALNRQASYSPRPPTFHYGLDYTRYNRIEGLSTAVEADEDLGAGYSARALARLGTDLEPDGELGISRTNGRETYTLDTYRRLNSANDWGGDPFTLGASLSSLLFGHDEGVYYRSWGAELTRSAPGSIVDSWRFFGEQDFGATVHSHFSLSGKLGGGYFPNNIDVTRGTIVGLTLRKRGEIGDDPQGLRVFSDVQLEGAAGSFDYTRAMANVTISHPITHDLDGALTLSGGTSGGTVPTQRLWYLGGFNTVRGQDVGVEVGDEYWLTRAELGLGSVFFKPVVFGDLGWAGDRRDWGSHMVPASGAGVGASLMDGLIRLDIAKGIRPTGGVRAIMYLDARF